MLAVSNLRLHKIASNRATVRDAFPMEDRASTIKDFDPSADDLPDQRSLGIRWNIVTDTFTFQAPDTNKPYTRRGLLSVVNSLFDPLGFLAPVIIRGRLLLRELSSVCSEWDVPLPENKHEEWNRWLESLQELKELHIPRTYSSFSLSSAQCTEVCIFSDASVKAIAAVAYLKVTDQDGHTEVGFLLGKTKLAPQPELTVPRLELCAAVLAVEIAELIVKEIDLKPSAIRFYTDSKVVLGYICNQSRRFYVYVNNRIQRIRQTTLPKQWNYVPTEQNPADCGSRSVSAAQLQGTTWLTGPSFLRHPKEVPSTDPVVFKLVDPEHDVEVRDEVKVLSTHVKSQLGSGRFNRFSTWKSLVRAIAHLSHIAHCFVQPSNTKGCSGWHICTKGLLEDALTKAENIIVKNVQSDAYSSEFQCIELKESLSSHSSLLKLNPAVDKNGLLRVGGRIAQAGLVDKETNPVIVPSRSHVTSLLVRHYHENVQHQGRHFTEGAIRASGWWIVGAKRRISSEIQRCIKCRRLRGSMEVQQMAELPHERLQSDPPFSYVGLDVFGPWEVTARRTKGGQANSKRWAVLFTCMCTRAVHIEVIEEMSSKSFINALRRFFAIRGPAKQLRSDRGTNFVGASKELKMDSAEDSPVQKYLLDQRCTWVFNPPHSSHMGGAWERLMGIARRILDSMLLQLGRTQLTHEILTTFMSEVTAIINARPLIPVSSDPECPLILTPAMLLTQKTGSSPVPCSDVSEGELLRHQWRRVQSLADTFWNRWRKEYLSTLQARHKWQHKRPNLKEGESSVTRVSRESTAQFPARRLDAREGPAEKEVKPRTASHADGHPHSCKD
ncbi:uncharacterized protein [Salminus brasiliensis]|uniref:uncharacterized protein n=1 Tax=Salminus brasiliensis TaxID=930266 RepID=UPI003B83262C